MRFFNKEKGFSLAETLIVLLIVALVVIGLAPMITKKRNNLNSNAAHGKWACKNVGDKMYSATASDTDAPLGSWKSGCVFPLLAKNVKYLWVEVYGAGGGGSRGNATPWISEKKIYNANEPVELEGDYDLEYNINDFDSLTVYWLDKVNSNGGRIYDVSPAPEYASLKKYCDFNSRFYSYEKQEKTAHVYANCKNYTYANDKCTHTGDGGPSGTMKETDCIEAKDKEGKPINQEGYYCVKQYGNESPPKYFYDADYFIKKCQADSGKLEDCQLKNDTVIYKTYLNLCNEIGYLSGTAAGTQTSGIYGTIYMKKGEYLIDEKTEGQKYPKGSLGGYNYSESKDGNTHKIYHVKTSTDGGLNITKTLISTIVGIKAGKMTANSNIGIRCCTTCTNVPGYPNSVGKTGPFCSIDGKDSVVTIAPAFKNTIAAGNKSYKRLSIMTQVFERKQGCYGENGTHAASLFPASGNKTYVFKVGKGGAGAQGKENNIVDASAQKGEDTYFGWVSVPGGFGGKDYCFYDAENPKKPTENPYGNDIGLGGNGGSVSYTQVPGRNYSLSISEDQEPKGRWKVENGQNGGTGMIIVSW